MLRRLYLAVRVLLRSPAFTLAALAALALGVGANTVMFAVLEGLVFHAVPFPKAEQLVQAFSTSAALGTAPAFLSQAEFKAIAANAKAFGQTGEYRHVPGRTLENNGHFAHVSAVQMSPALLRLLGVPPLLGHLFPNVDPYDPDPRLVILSHHVWSQQFGSDREIIGKATLLDNKSYVVIGVMPPEFAFPSPFDDVWLPEPSGPMNPYGPHDEAVIGRLRPGVDVRALAPELEAAARSLSKQYPNLERDLRFEAVPLQDEVAGPVKPAILVLFAATSVLLLITCANVANLVVARNAGRRREIAVRMALGATRRTIAREMMTETSILAVAGGALALIVVPWGFDAVRLFAPPSYAAALRLHLNLPVLLFGLAASCLAAFFLGSVSVLRISTTGLYDSLKEGSSTAPSGHGFPRSGGLQSILVIGQVALGLVLLSFFGALATSLIRLTSVPLGFDPQHLLVFELGVRLAPGGPDGNAAFFNRLLQEANATPGVQNAALGSWTPLGGFHVVVKFRQPNGYRGPNVLRTADMQIVSPGYFQTMGIPLIKGRPIVWRDTSTSKRVAVINRSMAGAFWPGQNPVGKLIDLNTEPGVSDQPNWCEVVGVVEDARDVRLEEEPVPEVYFPHLQEPGSQLSLYVRSRQRPSLLANSILKRIVAIDASQRVSHVLTMSQIVSRSLGEPRFRTRLMAAFAALALLVAAFGLYGLVSFSVAQIRKEIGIMMALGATPRGVAWMTLRQSLILTSLGIAAGLPLSLILAPLTSSLLFQTHPLSPRSLLDAAATMLLASAAAAYFPARRAAAVDPSVVLRSG